MSPRCNKKQGKRQIWQPSNKLDSKWRWFGKEKKCELFLWSLLNIKEIEIQHFFSPWTYWFFYALPNCLGFFRLLVRYPTCQAWGCLLFSDVKSETSSFLLLQNDLTKLWLVYLDCLETIFSSLEWAIILKENNSSAWTNIRCKQTELVYLRFFVKSRDKICCLLRHCTSWLYLLWNCPVFMEKMKTRYTSLCSLCFEVLEALIIPLIVAISDVNKDRYFLNLLLKLL